MQSGACRTKCIEIFKLNNPAQRRV